MWCYNIHNWSWCTSRTGGGFHRYLFVRSFPNKHPSNKKDKPKWKIKQKMPLIWLNSGKLQSSVPSSKSYGFSRRKASGSQWLCRCWWHSLSPWPSSSTGCTHLLRSSVRWQSQNFSVLGLRPGTQISGPEWLREVSSPPGWTCWVVRVCGNHSASLASLAPR